MSEDIAREVRTALSEALHNAAGDKGLEAYRELMEWSTRWEIPIESVLPYARYAMDASDFAREFASNSEAVEILAQAIEKHVAIVPTVDEIVRGTVRAIKESVFSYPGERES